MASDGERSRSVRGYTNAKIFAAGQRFGVAGSLSSPGYDTKSPAFDGDYCYVHYVPETPPGMSSSSGLVQVPPTPVWFSSSGAAAVPLPVTPPSAPCPARSGDADSAGGACLNAQPTQMVVAGRTADGKLHIPLKVLSPHTPPELLRIWKVPSPHTPPELLRKPAAWKTHSPHTPPELLRKPAEHSTMQSQPAHQSRTQPQPAQQFTMQMQPVVYQPQHGMMQMQMMLPFQMISQNMPAPVAYYHQPQCMQPAPFPYYQPQHNFTMQPAPLQYYYQPQHHLQMQTHAQLPTTMAKPMDL
jgi:hypothetical protein